jgi:serine/threonine-protein kinase ULK/ATG1
LRQSEIVARKLKQAQQQLPQHHPRHPSNHQAGSGSSVTVGSAEDITFTTGITAEKLMYDRALEMSRTAAVNELVGADLPGCDLNYQTAIWMLEAILEDDDESSSRKLDGEEINGLESEDRQSILKRRCTFTIALKHKADITLVLEGMKLRHQSLKKKLSLQKAQKRASITSAPAPHPSNRSSPSSQGHARR